MEDQMGLEDDDQSEGPEDDYKYEHEQYDEHSPPDSGDIDGSEDDDEQEYMEDRMCLEDDDQLEGPEVGDDVEYQQEDDDDE
ncbi:hypothetical protein Q3G72_035145 [Acer saccharum]|nr:hypothetical protein Q3G72_035145 [Acer saccharum]